MALALVWLAGCLLPWCFTATPPTGWWLALWLPPLLWALSRRAATRIWHLWWVLAIAGTWAEWQAERALRARLPQSLAGSPLEVEGRVVGLPEQDRRSIRFELRLTGAAPVGSSLRQVRLAWYDGFPLIRPGQIWRLSVRLRPPRGEVNPAGLDYERLALAQRIDAVGYVMRGEQLGVAALSIDGVRADGSAALGAALGPAPAPATALLQALVYGDTRGLQAEDWSLYRQTGTTHLIAISGTHIGVVAIAAGALGWWLWRWLWPLRRWPRRQVATVGGWAAALAYCLLAGFEIPAQRTLLGLTVVAAALLWRRQLSAWGTFSAALIVVLAWDPLAVLGAGFWLSFGAVAWLILAFGGRWRRPRWWQELWSAQWKIALLMVPLTMLLFQQSALLAPLTNLWAVPLVSVLVVPLALLGALLLPLPWLGGALLELAAWLAQCFIDGLKASVAWSWADVQLAPPSGPALTLALIGALLLIAPRGWPARWLAPLLWLPLLWPRPPVRVAEAAFELTVYDVGQGLSVLVRTARHALLYDTGRGASGDGQPVAATQVLPSLAALGITSLDLLMLSHGDDDHAGGSGAVRSALPVNRVLGSAPAAAVEPCVAGREWLWDGVHFQLLHPTPGLPYLRNESSCVLRISGRDGSALLPGDIGTAIEERLLKHQAAALDVDLLVSPHHGSAGSSGPAFVAATSPQWVVHATGYADRFGFPRAQTLERYAAAGAQQVDTGSAGAVRLWFDPRQRRWQAERLRSALPRRWRAVGSDLEAEN